MTNGTRKSGFTLIELLVVVAIIGTLASIIIASVSGARDKARIAAAQQFDETVRHTIGDSLVGEWLFNEQSGTVAYDTAGTNNSTIVGGATHVAGISGNALSFDGLSGYVSIPNGSNTVMPRSNAPFTITLWLTLASLCR